MSHTPRDHESDQRAWEEIVQRLQEPNTEPDSPPDQDSAGEPEVAAAAAHIPWRATLPGAEGLPPELAEDSEEQWSPPDPGRVTAGLSTGALTAWSLLIVVPVVLVVLGVVMNGLPWWLWLPGLATVIASVFTLLSELPEQRDLGDDGARL